MGLFLRSAPANQLGLKGFGTKGFHVFFSRVCPKHFKFQPAFKVRSLRVYVFHSGVEKAEDAVA